MLFRSDREPGRGGLQVWTARDGWEYVPYSPGSLTINAGDLLARWSGGRWMSNRHRVLPPQAEAPDEDLVSLVYFYEANYDAVIESLRPPIGQRSLAGALYVEAITMATVEFDIAAFIAAQPAMMDLLRAVEALNLPDGWIGAGFVRNPVWDALRGFPWSAS